MNRSRSVPLFMLVIIATVHQVLMGGTFVFARYALQQVDPFTVGFIRYTVAGSILMAVSRWRTRGSNAAPVTPADRKRIWLLGAVIILGNQTLYLYGQAFTTAVHGALLFTLTPIFVYLMAMRHLGEKWSLLKGAGILMAVAGSMSILLDRGLNLDWAALKGDLFIFVSVAAWASYLVWGKPLVGKYGAFRASAYTLASGALIYFPFGLYRFLTADLSRLDTMGWWSIVYVTMVTSVIGYSIWYWLLKFMEASRVSVLSNAQPIVAGALGFFLLRETVTAPFIVGAIIILIGVMLTQMAGGKTKGPEAVAAGPLP
ncbi:MAG: DMT family transporter [candidate division Zixibacteria bacterium]|nr:DMT family transporter [candidate division Zixibacteria bacterium]